MKDENGEKKDLAIIDKPIVAIDSPVLVEDAKGNLVSLGTKAFELYYCKGATMEELFLCVNQTRATGLNPLIPGECYYFRTGDRPMSLFTGYPVYLRKAKEAGLEHYSFEFDNDEKPTVCTVTLQIQGDRPDFTWPTWFDEVAATTRDGKLNARWKKAPRQMFIKCSIVNTLRMSMLVDFSLPYTIEEMPDPIAPGYRTLTQDQLGTYNLPESADNTGEASIGKVDAANHQVDLTDERIHYFVRLKAAGIQFEDGPKRRVWQGEMMGEEKSSTTTWTAKDYMEMGDILAELRLGNKAMGKTEPKATEAEGDQEDPPEPSGAKPEEAEAKFYSEASKRFNSTKALGEWAAKWVSQKPMKEWKAEEFQTALPILIDVPLLEDQKGSAEEPATKDDKPVEDAVEEAAREGTLEVAKSHFLDMLLVQYPNIEDRMKWIAKNIPAPVNEMDTWEHKYFEQGIELLSEMSSPTQEPEGEQNEQEGGKGSSRQPDNDEGDYGILITQETKSLIDAALLDFPGKKYGTIRTSAFRKMAYKAIDHDYTLYNKILNSDGRLILAALVKEEAAILFANLGDGEPVVTGEVVAGEIVDDNPLNPIDEDEGPIEDGMLTPEDAQEEAEAQDAFSKEQEESRGDLLESYLEKAGERFADKAARKTWERDQELPFDLSIAKWPESEIKRGYAMLEGVTKLTGVPSGEPLMNDGQLGEMQGKIGDMHEQFHDSLGSQPFLDLVFKVTKPKRKKLKDLTEAEADEVIMQMADAVGTEKARKTAQAKAAE